LNSLILAEKVSSPLVSFYVDTSPGGDSLVNFGGYDYKGYSHELFMLYTADATWSLSMKEASIGSTAVPVADLKAIINPAFPHIYLPKKVFEAFVE
jgi:hypothetical protein